MTFVVLFLLATIHYQFKEGNLIIALLLTLIIIILILGFKIKTSDRN
jgi:integral membrane sensor domain MASE1